MESNKKNSWIKKCSLRVLTWQGEFHALPWQIFLMLFAIGIIAYANVMNGEFIWDDKALILMNEHAQSLKYFPQWFTESTLEGAGIETSNLYRPVVTFFYAIIFSIFGPQEFAYHALNLLVHIVNGFLVFTLLQKLNFARFGSLLAAVIFLVHPVQTESVSYIAGLPDLLSPLFILLGLNILIDGKNRLDLKRKILVAILTALAILSKETGIIFVPLAILAVWYKWNDYSKEARADIIKTILIASAVTLAYIILKITMLNFTGSLSLNPRGNVYTENILFRIYTFFAAIVDYLRLIIYPVDLYFEKPFLVYTSLMPKAQFGVLIVLISTVCAGFSLYNKKHFYFVYVWFALTIGLVSGILIPLNATYKEHWLYMPLIGIVLLIPSIWEKFQTKKARQIFLAVFAMVTVLSILQTANRNTEWKNLLTFFRTEMSYNQTSPRLRDELGSYYFEKGEYEKAAEYFKLGVELDKDDNLPNIRTGLGNAYLAMKNLDAAVNEYFTVLSTHPNYFEAHVALYNIAIATHNKKMEAAFLEFLQRMENGETVDFETEILPFGVAPLDKK